MRRKKSPAYLDYIRSLPCVICGDSTTVEAAHIRMGARRAGKRPTGMGEKSDDRWALPLCGKHHRLQHMHYERYFWSEIAGRNHNPFYLSLALQSVAGDAEAGEGIIRAWMEA